MVGLGLEKKILYSSDFPHEVNSETCRHELNELMNHPVLSDQDKDAILCGNAMDFYNL